MEKYVSAEWLKKQVKVIGITTGENFERLIDAAPSINVDQPQGNDNKGGHNS